MEANTGLEEISMCPELSPGRSIPYHLVAPLGDHHSGDKARPEAIFSKELNVEK